MPRGRQSHDINAGSMADIAFLLLIFFLVTTTMDIDKGIYTRLPEWDEEFEDVKLNKRNVLDVLINSRDQLLVKGELFDIKNLKKEAKKHIDNNKRDPNYSDSPKDAVVSLKNDRGTSYDIYIQVQNELKAAYREIWDREGMRRYGKVYGDLKREQKKAIRKDYPRKFSEAEPEDLGGGS